MPDIDGRQVALEGTGKADSTYSRVVQQPAEHGCTCDVSRKHARRTLMMPALMSKGREGYSMFR